MGKSASTRIPLILGQGRICLRLWHAPMDCTNRSQTLCAPLGEALSRTAKILSFPDVVPASACQLCEGHLTRPALSLPVLCEWGSFGAVGKRSRERSAKLHGRNPQAPFARIAPPHFAGLKVEGGKRGACPTISTTNHKSESLTHASAHHHLHLHLLPACNARALTSRDLAAGSSGGFYLLNCCYR